MPMEPLALAHHREVQGAERIGVAIKPLLVQRRANEIHQRLPFVQTPHRGVGRKLIVGDDADRGVIENSSRMILRERVRSGISRYGSRSIRCDTRARTARSPSRTEQFDRGGRDEIPAARTRRSDRVARGNDAASARARITVQIDDRIALADRSGSPATMAPAVPSRVGIIHQFPLRYPIVFAQAFATGLARRHLHAPPFWRAASEELLIGASVYPSETCMS